jgi:hypothetical protein
MRGGNAQCRRGGSVRACGRMEAVGGARLRRHARRDRNADHRNDDDGSTDRAPAQVAGVYRLEGALRILERALSPPSPIHAASAPPLLFAVGDDRRGLAEPLVDIFDT